MNPSTSSDRPKPDSLEPLNSKRKALLGGGWLFAWYSLTGLSLSGCGSGSSSSSAAASASTTVDASQTGSTPVVQAVVSANPAPAPNSSPPASPPPASPPPASPPPASPPPASPPTPGLGSSGLTFQDYQDNPPQISVSLSEVQTTGSIVITGLGGEKGNLTVPSDSAGNSYTQRGAILLYDTFPDYGNALAYASNARGGQPLVITATKLGVPSDEMTITAVEVTNASRISDFNINYPRAGQLGRSGSVTTTGPAILLAWWWGDGDSSLAHVATPNNGFTVINEILLPGGLVQCCVAYRKVSVAGTYDVTWSMLAQEGAILWLVAVE